jgi:hypothetical protein
LKLILAQLVEVHFSQAWHRQNIDDFAQKITNWAEKFIEEKENVLNTFKTKHPLYETVNYIESCAASNLQKKKKI